MSTRMPTTLLAVVMVGLLPMVHGNPGPGTYGHYQFPNAGKMTGTDMEVENVWTTIPKPTDMHGNAVFASMQYWYESGAAGYMGTQVFRSGSVETHKAIFSCWDADKDIKTGWVGPNCSRFGGEGVGSHCLITYPIDQGVHYAVRVAFTGKNASGAMWTGTITNQKTKKATIIGTLFQPNYKGNIGYGNFKVQAASFQEYFAADGCENQAVSGVGLVGPYFNNRTIVASQAEPDFATGCDYSDVTACIPGETCGAPNIFMSAGGKTKRTTKKDQKLW